MSDFKPVAEVSHLLSVGTEVEYHEGSWNIKGVVGEITSGRFYIFNDVVDGSMGKIYPKTRDYLYSWSVSRFDTTNVIKFVNKSNSFMNLIEKFKLAAKSEPEKSFIKASILNMDGSFTSEGKEVFLEWLLQSNGDAFKKDVVDPILEEEKSDK